MRIGQTCSCDQHRKIRACMRDLRTSAIRSPGKSTEFQAVVSVAFDRSVLKVHDVSVLVVLRLGWPTTRVFRGPVMQSRKRLELESVDAGRNSHEICLIVALFVSSKRGRCRNSCKCHNKEVKKDRFASFLGQTGEGDLCRFRRKGRGPYHILLWVVLRPRCETGYRSWINASRSRSTSCSARAFVAEFGQECASITVAYSVSAIWAEPRR